MATDLIKALSTLTAERAAIRQREQKVISGLQEVLVRLGYRLEAVDTNGSVHEGAALTRRHRGLPVKNLVCSHCGRRFALPLHLGRHVSAMHDGKRSSRATAEGGAATTSKTPMRLRRRMSSRMRRAA